MKSFLETVLKIFGFWRRFYPSAANGLLSAVLLAGLAGVSDACADEWRILNVSYDPTRELYQDLNAAFIKKFNQASGNHLVIRQSHGGSGKQARAVIDGLEADMVSLALAYDIDAIAQRGLIAPNWQTRRPYNSSPYASSIVLLVRKGNPKNIRDWGDIVKPDTEVITPNPKTSGGARWNYLAAWTYAAQQPGASEASIRDFISKLLKNVKVLDAGARGATTTFVERGIGDVLIAWENEAYLAQNELGKDRFEIVFPSVSILAEPPVALVDKVADKRGTRAIVDAFLDFLYSPEGQEIIARHYYRPRDPKVMEAYADKFQKMKLTTVEEAFGGWSKAQAVHFADGGTFDQLFGR